MKANPEIDLIQGRFDSEEEIFVADYFQPGKTINLRECVLGPTFFGKRHIFFQLKGFNSLSDSLGRAIEATLLGESPEKALKTAQDRLELIWH